MDPRAVPYLIAGAWGFVGALVYGSFRLRAILCNGECDPTPQLARKAWSEFFGAILTGTVLAAGLTDPMHSFVPRLNFVGSALVIGLLSSHMLPGLLDTANEVVKNKLGGWLVQLGNSMTKKKEEA